MLLLPKSCSLDLPVLVGAHIAVPAGQSEHHIVALDQCVPIQQVSGFIAIEAAEMFGRTAVTAYYSLVDIAMAGSSDTVMISGAGGTVGSMAI